MNAFRKFMRNYLKNTWMLMAVAFGVTFDSTAVALPTLELLDDSISNVSPGGEFTIYLQIVNPDPITIVSYDFVLSADVDDVFVITAQTLSEPLSMSLFSGSLPYQVSLSGVLDFGAADPEFEDGIGMGTFQVQSITFQTKPTTAPGSYSVFFGWVSPSVGSGPNLVDANFNEYTMMSPVTLSVSVVPEPSSINLVFVTTVVCVVLFAQRRLRITWDPAGGVSQ